MKVLARCLDRVLVRRDHTTVSEVRLADDVVITGERLQGTPRESCRTPVELAWDELKVHGCDGCTINYGHPRHPLRRPRVLPAVRPSARRISVEPLASLTNLTQLDLSRTNLDDISALAGLTKLWSQAICSTRVPDISALAELRSLKLLSVSATPVGDIGVLAKLPKLRAVDVSSSKVSKAQVEKLRAQKPGLRITQSSAHNVLRRSSTASNACAILDSRRSEPRR